MKKKIEFLGQPFTSKTFLFVFCFFWNGLFSSENSILFVFSLVLLQSNHFHVFVFYEHFSAICIYYFKPHSQSIRFILFSHDIYFKTLKIKLFE